MPKDECTRSECLLLWLSPQKLQCVDVLEGDAGHLPHVYREEGECEGAETLSSLSFLEQDLYPELLDCLGLNSAPSEAVCSAPSVPS